MVRLVLLAIPALLLAAPVPYTAPDGDLNQDGSVDSLDLQCEVLLYSAVTEAELCISNDQCEPDAETPTVCRTGFAGLKLCLPACLATEVSVGAPGACADPQENSPACLGLTPKRIADFNCDGQLTVTDMLFHVAIIMGKVGGTDTADFDSDGRLNYCDDDSDGDGLDDDQDPEPLVPAVPNCDDSNLCTADSYIAGQCQHQTEPGPCQWPGQWSLSAGNPVLTPTPTNQNQGADNIYAADILKVDGAWWMWYGAQGGDGRDAVFLARSKDLVTWQKHPSWAGPQPVVDHGNFNHVNDPSVVQVGGTFYMYYTGAPNLEDDRIYLATSQDGISWVKHGMVLDVGAADSWEPDRVGRPSVLYEDGEFRMWYDGQIYGVARHVGYATSPDGYAWTKAPANPVVLNEGAIDVDRVGDWYVMLAESGQGTKLYVAKDPLTWKYVGMMWGKSGQPYDAYGQVTPFLLTDGGQAKAIYFGGASDSCWCKNRIAVAFPGPDVAGCSKCVAGVDSCQPACAGAGFQFGFCGAPGSNNPDACCHCCNDWECVGCQASCTGKQCGDDGCGGTCGTCQPGQMCDSGQCKFTGCNGCLAGQPNCDVACQASGFSTGSCGTPGSIDPSACCACEYANCVGCLEGFGSCAAKCQSSGKKSGSCAHPKSDNPSVCCQCEDWTNCEGCLGQYSNCDDACHYSGHPGGHCAVPNSTNPSSCCGCDPATGCGGCLGGQPSCMAACQAAGANGGWCAVPGSQNPGACCSCF